jgi:hypothetical protein
MSRGIGKLQRKVLQCLEPDAVLNIMQIAACIHGPVISRAEYESLRRALHGLENRGLAEKLWWHVTPSKPWATSATADILFEKFVEAMDRVAANKRCSGNDPTLSAANKRCSGNERNAYPAPVDVDGGIESRSVPHP